MGDTPNEKNVQSKKSHPLSGNGRDRRIRLKRAAIRAFALSRSCVLSAAGCWQSAHSALY